MESLSTEQQRLLATLVTALDRADTYPTPDLALAVHFGTHECPSVDPRVNRVSESVRGAVTMLHRQNPEAFLQAVDGIGGSFAFRVNAILGRSVGQENGTDVASH